MYTESVSLTFETDPAMNVIELVEHIKRKKEIYKVRYFFSISWPEERAKVLQCIFEACILSHECN